MTATDEPLLLETLVPEGAAEEAISSLRGLGQPGAFLRRQLLLALPFVALVVLTRDPIWLLGYLALLGLGLWARSRIGVSGLRSHGLPPGALIQVEWGTDALVVHRPASTVHFGYDGMEVATRTDRLTGLSVRDGLGDGRPKTLYLPSELVPREAVVRFQRAAAPGQDPFDAAGMPRVFRVPPGWPRVGYGLSAAGVTLLAVAGCFELLLLALLVVAGQWLVAAALGALLLAFVVFIRVAPFRPARRLLPPGSLAGLSLSEGRVVIVLPDRRIDLPESRLRNVLPCGDDLVNVQFVGTNLAMIPVPRALITDEEIDRLRAVAGRRPMRASQRLN